jgi:hypothetical protein
MTRFKIWEKIAADNGYKIEYRKFSYWSSVPYAVKGNECFPLAFETYQGGSSVLITLNDIVANDNNFYRLASYHDRPEMDDDDFDPYCDYTIKINSRGNIITE